jgi:hypothetical protein
MCFQAMCMYPGTIFLFSCEAALFEKVKDKVTCFIVLHIPGYCILIFVVYNGSS